MAIDIATRVQNIRAAITSNWSGKGYSQLIVPRIESYYVDTALDQDADQWQIEIGDPKNRLNALLDRNNEIRTQLFGFASNGLADYVMTGLGDDIERDEAGRVTITGRDLSSLATDSVMRPARWKHVRAHAIVAEQAKFLGFKRTNLVDVSKIKKLEFTDGSETYWEFWYRLYRREKGWIWCEPDGTLVANKLDYGPGIDYYFGSPRGKDSNQVISAHIPVIGVSWRKGTQGRIGEVWVYGHWGDNGFLVTVTDPTIAKWLKKPRKIMLDTEAHSSSAAKKLAYEEIFESKVGAVEIKLTVSDPGFRIHQNRVARVHIPDMDLFGNYYVIGSRMQASAEGFLQEVRLRELQYAVSRRIPADPKKTASASVKNTGTISTGLGSKIGDMPAEWAQYFVLAANQFHGPWDYDLFLATLLGICHVETGFINERQHGGPGGDAPHWYPYSSPVGVQAQAPGGPVVTGGETLHEWKTKFANESGDGYVTVDYGVGPMQLTSLGIKHNADDHMKAGNRDEWSGGRWHPEHNIWAAAKTLRSDLQATVKDSGRDIDIWMGVMAFNRGAAGAISYFNTYGQISDYAVKVKNAVYKDPGFLGDVKTARQQAADAAKQNDPGKFQDQPGVTKATGVFVNSPGDLAKLNFLVKQNSGVDLVHVNPILLTRLNALGAAVGTITVTSGYRSHAEQQALWDRYVKSGYNPAYIAADPNKGKGSNHMIGEACDCVKGGVALSLVVPKTKLAQYKLHASVSGDPVHITRMEVWN